MKLIEKRQPFLRALGSGKPEVDLPEGSVRLV